MKAKVAYTYGWTDKYIDSLEFRVFLDYYKSITPIEAEAQLRGFEVAIVPNLDKKTRRELVRNYKKMMAESVERPTKKLGSIQDVAKAFARMRMNG